MVTAGRSPRMMAQKGQVAGISREPTAAPSLAQGGVRARRGDLEALLRDADALDRHPGRKLRDVDVEVQAAEYRGRYPARVDDLDVDPAGTRLGDLGGGRLAERAEIEARLDPVRAVGAQRDALRDAARLGQRRERDQ